MNRELKFRAWHKFKKEMVAVEKLGLDPRSGWSNCATCGLTIGTDGSVYELMQFTGLRDKNGREIYEGDVIQIEPNSLLLIVQYRGSRFIGLDKFQFPWDIESALDMDGEIIGNSYENPDLLEPPRG